MNQSILLLALVTLLAEFPRADGIPEPGWTGGCIEGAGVHRADEWFRNGFLWGFADGPPDGSNCIECRCGRVSHDGLSDEETRMTRPGVEQWEQFWVICDEADVWAWPNRFGDMTTIDGLTWRLSIRWGERQVHSNDQCCGAPQHHVEGLWRIYRQLTDMTDWQGPPAW